MPQASQLFGTNMCTTSGLLTAAGNETVYDTTVIVNFSVDGAAYAKAAVTDGTTPVVDGDGIAFPPLAVTNEDGSITGKCAAIVWALNAAGTVVCYQGEINELDGLTTDPLFDLQLPALPDTETAFAYQILKQATDGATADTATFGASNWDATRFTNTITNVFTLPRRPQSS